MKKIVNYFKNMVTVSDEEFEELFELFELLHIEKEKIMEDLLQELLDAALELRKMKDMDISSMNDLFESLNEIITKIEDEEEGEYTLSTKYSELLSDIIEEAELVGFDDTCKNVIEEFIEEIEEDIK